MTWLAVLTEIYIEALLVDENLADEVWDAWDKREISDFWPIWMWIAIVLRQVAPTD